RRTEPHPHRPDHSTLRRGCRETGAGTPRHQPTRSHRCGVCRRKRPRVVRCAATCHPRVIGGREVVDDRSGARIHSRARSTPTSHANESPSKSRQRVTPSRPKLDPTFDRCNRFDASGPSKHVTMHNRIAVIIAVFTLFTPLCLVAQPADGGGAASDVAALVEEGKNAYRTKDFDKAVSVFRQVVDADPSIYEAHVGLGRALERLQKYDEAV